MKILVIGAYGEGNFGDDVLMHVVENILVRNFPRSEIHFLTQQKNLSRLLHRAGVVGREEAESNCYDFVVFGGGTQFYSFAPGGFKRMAIGIRSLLRRLLVRPAAPLASANTGGGWIGRVPHFGLGIGVGPFASRVHARHIADRLRRFDFVGVRDSASVEFGRRHGLPNFRVGADLCFSSYLNIHDCGDPADRPPSVPGGKRKVAVIVRDWVHTREGGRYCRRLLDFCRRPHREIDFTFVVFAPERDRQWLERLSHENLPVILWRSNEGRIGRFLDQLRAFDGFITARYHGAVFAALLGKPTICVEVEQKLRMATEQIPEFLLWRRNFDVSELQMLVDSLFTRGHPATSVQALKTRADAMIEAFIRQAGTLPPRPDFQN